FSLLQECAHHRPPHSLPTRRSSDLQASAQSRLKIHPHRVILLDTVHGRASADKKSFQKSSRHGDEGQDEGQGRRQGEGVGAKAEDRKSTRLNSSHVSISYAVFCLTK